ncbi:Qat anti-phage system TatD family nuclease QatD [Mesorhizobium sp. B1-1-5]|uniref:Qat anti-phage system TatD family nuclease QatD n=1 Tax=Mesorhizobium sp. B1-1-5 TaxID=2589979 RepID=UPI00112B25B3|nr:Qat anti-phage system TatD family nuclease QatD [Mesorhizobium sp. B1-1-5]TPO13753.1 TatD family deoxyribonuclease [Mesorhizobium sp. B1-1-5]
MTSTPRFVDFHCHLDLYPDLAKAIALCEEARTATLAVTTTPKAFRQNQKLAKGKEFVRVALGLHPHLADARWNELALFEALLPETRYVGEIGLDAGPRFYRSMEKQTEVFRQILQLCATRGGKVLSIHAVRATAQILDHLEELFPRSAGRVVFHWFSGTITEARRAAAFGCYFSVNQAMFRNGRGQELVRSLPLDRILTETDGPFVEVGDKPVNPGDVAQAVKLIAAAMELETETLRRQVVSNFAALVADRVIS